MTARSLVQISLFAALIAALGLLPALNLPFAGGVPITAQTLGVMMAGLVLGPRLGALAVMLFLMVVALGGPFLAGGRGGLGVFQLPSAGFLIGFPFGAAATGWLIRRWPMRGRGLLFWSAFAAAVIGGIGVIYLFGIPGLAIMTNMTLPQAALASLAFVPGDLIKAALAAAVYVYLARAMPSAITGVPKR